jgi:hypothetical protein
VRGYEPVCETDYVSLLLAHSLSGVSEEGLASLLFGENDETPILRSAVVAGEELVDLRDLLRPGPRAVRTRRTRR